MAKPENFELKAVAGFHRLPTTEKHYLHMALDALTDQDIPELFYQFWIHDPEEGPLKGIKYATQNGHDKDHTKEVASSMQKNEESFRGSLILPVNENWFPSHGVLKVCAHVLDREGFAQEIEVGTLTKNDQEEIKFKVA